jgi:hypothetical protein
MDIRVQAGRQAAYSLDMLTISCWKPGHTTCFVGNSVPAGQDWTKYRLSHARILLTQDFSGNPSHRQDRAVVRFVNRRGVD